MGPCRPSWSQLGRTALLKTSKSDVDLHLGGWGHWPSVLQIPPQTLARMDHPARLSQLEQVKLFRYALNVEGHGGWADRLYQLLDSPQLVIAQDLPHRLWYEGLMSPGVTHLAVDARLSNISAAVAWARAHEAEARRMVRRANRAIELATSVAGIRHYVRALLEEYAGAMADGGSATAELHPRAVEFSCKRRHRSTCERCHGGDGAPREVCAVRCTFRAPRPGAREATTLYEASLGLPR